jgi:lysophospholipase L1-like esterase
MNFICFGDSITETGSSPNGWCTQLQSHLDAANPGAHEVVVAGFGGRHSGELLDRMGEHVLPHLPATVLIATGINDAYHQAWQAIPRVSLAEFRRNLAEIVRVVRELGGQPVLIAGHELSDRGIFVQGNGRPQPENFAPYHAAIVALAAELAVPLIDIAAAARSRGLDHAALVADDGVHLSASGHDAYAAIVADFLKSLPA